MELAVSEARAFQTEHVSGSNQEVIEWISTYLSKLFGGSSRR